MHVWPIARLGSSLLRMNFPTMWFVGFYTVKPDDVTVLQIGPYQGSVLACGTIAYGRGVCGTAAASGETQIVDDVNAIETTSHAMMIRT